MLQNICVTLMSQLAYEHLFRSRKLVSALVEGTTERVLHAALYWKPENEDNIGAFLEAMSQAVRKLKPSGA